MPQNHFLLKLFYQNLSGGLRTSGKRHLLEGVLAGKYQAFAFYRLTTGSIAKFDSKTERPGNVLFGGPYLRALQQFGLGR
jgi:hypothetical protein